MDNIYRVFPIDTKKSKSIFSEFTLEDLLQHPGREEILLVNERARCYYEAVMTKKQKTSWVMLLHSDPELKIE